MPSARLTDAFIKTLKPAPDGREFFVFDTDVPQFFVRVRPSGKISFNVQFRTNQGGRLAPQRRMALKGSGTVSEMRAQAKKILARVQLGDDPGAERAEARASPSVADLLDRYLREEVGPLRAASTLRLYQIYKNHVTGVLGSRQVNTLKPRDIVTLRNSLAGDDGARRVTSNRTVAFLSAALTWGRQHEASLQGRDNPCGGAQRFKEEARQRYLSADELARLGEALRLAEKPPGLPWAEPPRHKNEPKEKRFTVLGEHVCGAIRLLALTGCRLREILDLEWSAVDLEQGVLRLKRTKTGPRVVVLNGAAIEVLKNLHAVKLGPFVIPGLDPSRPRADLNRPWRALCEHAGLEGVHLHDLRHGYASIGVQGNLGLPVVGALLGHKEQSTTMRYSHWALDPLRRAADMIGDQLAAALAGRKN